MIRRNVSLLRGRRNNLSDKRVSLEVEAKRSRSAPFPGDAWTAPTWFGWTLQIMK